MKELQKVARTKHFPSKSSDCTNWFALYNYISSLDLPGYFGPQTVPFKNCLLWRKTKKLPIKSERRSIEFFSFEGFMLNISFKSERIQKF